jgi:hypothetical protein
MEREWQPFFNAVERLGTRLEFMQFDLVKYEQLRMAAVLAAHEVVQRVMDSREAPV